MTYIPRICEVNTLGGYIVEVEFTNSTKKKIDLSYIKNYKGIFEPLHNQDYFEKVFCDGWTISWPNGADISPETLYRKPPLK